MDYASWRSLPAMFFEMARQRGARPFLWAKRDGIYQELSWSQTEEDVRFAFKLAESTAGRVFFTAGRDLDRTPELRRRTPRQDRHRP